MRVHSLLTVSIAALAALTLSGCFGYPAGSARPGDTVQVRYMVTDAETGKTLVANATQTFPLGQSASGLGCDVEAALYGLKPGAAVTVDSKSDPCREKGATRTFPSDLPDAFSGSLTQTMVAAEYRARSNGAPSQVGTAYTDLQYGVNGTVVASDGANVTTTLQVHDGQEVPLPSYGVNFHFTVAAGSFDMSLTPMVGHHFVLTAQNDPYGFPPAGYTTVGIEDGQLQFRQDAPHADWTGKQLRITVTVVQVTPAVAGQTTDSSTDNYGVRRSPVLQG